MLRLSSRFGICVLVASALGQTTQPFTDVPFVATPDNVVDAMLDLAAIHPGDVLVDLGSGDGRIPIEAAKRFGIHAIGVEIDPELVARSQELAHQAGVSDKVTFVRQDLFQFDLRKATVVTMFLTPGVNVRLRAKLLTELEPGARIVCHRFDLGSWVPEKTVTIDDDHLYLWTVTAGRSMSTQARIPQAVAPTKTELDAMFAYDSHAALNPQSETIFHGDGPHLARISFDGARGPVSATLVTPERSGKVPAVIFAHDYGKKDEFLSEAFALARAALPCASLLIDAPAERPLGWRRNFNSLSDSDNDRDIHIQAVLDLRRGIDLLSARADVDASHIAFVGHGYGANWGAILGSVDSRVRAFVLIAGFPSFGALVDRDDPDWANVRYAMGPDRFARYQASIATVDPILFTRFWNKAPVLLQFGRFDEFVSIAAAESFAKSFGRVQTTHFYDAGHSVNAASALADRTAFLTRWMNPEASNQ